MWDLVAGAAGNISANITSHLVWEPQPAHRGTFSILSTCFVTLALCTWKIVHLNLPGTCPDDDLPWAAWWRTHPGTAAGAARGGGSPVVDGGWRHRAVHLLGGHALVRRIGWLLIGLFAPELIAFAAFEQYWDVQSLQKFMEEVYVGQEAKTTTTRSWWPPSAWCRSGSPAATTDDDDDDDVERRAHDAPEKPPWTLTHSWYAIMGGYSYHLRDNNGPAGQSVTHLPDDHGRRRVVLREEAVRFVAVHEPALLPRLPEATILDKSSAGTFVKVIALFQALWFSLQCVARMGQGLALSLLELTTFAHCVVALIIGWLWLKKPADIQEPDPLMIPPPRVVVADGDDYENREEEEEAEENDLGVTAHWLMAMLYTLSSFDHGEEADEDKWRKLTPGQTERLRAAAAKEKEEHDDDDNNTTAVNSPAYLQPLGDHGPMSFAELGWDHDQQQQPGPASSRPNTRSGRPVTAPRLEGPPKNSSGQSLSELIQSAADAEQRLRVRMELAHKGWAHYILDADAALLRPLSSSSPATTVPFHPPTLLGTPISPAGKAQQQQEREQQQQAEEEDPYTLQRNLKRTLRNTLCDRVPNFPRRRHQPTTKQYQPAHHHHHPHPHGHSDHQDQDHNHEEHPQPAAAAEQHRHTTRTHLGITLAGFLYGGLHLLAWDATFTSAAERTLWRVAALSLAASGLLVPVSHAQGYVSDAVRPWLAMDEDDRDAEEAAHLRAKAQEILHGSGGLGAGGNKRAWWRRWAWKVYRWCFLWMVEVARVSRVAVLVVFALVYIGLRLFVFLESLVNIVHLPASAYDTVQWSQYVPHIS